MGAAARVRLLLLLPLLLGLGCSRNGGRCSSAQTLLPEQEVEALKGIARKLNKVDWDFSVDPCSGSGNWANVTGSLSSNAKFSSNVTCDCSFNNHTECHVISLELMRHNLSGVLPDEVVNLTYLQNLDLSRNFIQGPIPASWADLPVFNLSLQGNRISGTLPKELGRMPKLKSIQLEGNQLAGSIPPELGNIISLQRLFGISYRSSGLWCSSGNLKQVLNLVVPSCEGCAKRLSKGPKGINSLIILVS